MSRFTSPLMLRALGPEEVAGAKASDALFQLTEDFIYESDLLGCALLVAAGFITDFASIPRAALWYVNGDDPAILFPSVAHDWIYSHQGRMPDGRTFTRAQADAVLREAMGLCGARADQRAAVFLAVRVGGGSHWKP